MLYVVCLSIDVAISTEFQETCKASWDISAVKDRQMILPPKWTIVTLKKSGLNVTSDSFITMASKQSITLPSTAAVWSRSPCAHRSI